MILSKIKKITKKDYSKQMVRDLCFTGEHLFYISSNTLGSKRNLLIHNSLPDLDIDYFADTDDVTDDFIIKKYGRERFLAVSTFSLFNEKGCLKDVVRAHLGEEHTGFQSDVHAVTKEMPNFDKVEYSLREWFESWPKNVACSERVKNWLTAPSNKLILEQTLKLQGQIRGIGQHAAGITITPGPSWDYLPVNIIASNKNLVTAFQEADKSGKDLSELGILKLDRLKIVALNIIKAAIDLVKEKKGIDIKDKVDYVDLEDPNLFGEVRLGINQGVFQFESAGMGALLKGMAVSSFEELVASNALYRPGPMGIGAHEEYIKNKFNPENISYIHPALEPILKDTNGVLVFQEQLMFLASKIGGMTLGEGDTLRRYMDKASSAIKKKSQGEELNIREEANYKEFESIWNKFLNGAEKNGYKVNEIDKIKDWVIKYLGYSFNRCLTKNHTVVSESRGEISMLDVNIGEKILGYNPDKKVDEFVPVKDIHINGIKKVYRIKTTSGKTIECTEDHKIMTESGMKTLREIIDNKIKVKIKSTVN